MTSAAACDVCGYTETSYVYGMPLCAECRGDPARVNGLAVSVEHEETKEVGEQITVDIVHEVRIELKPAEATAVSARFSAEHARHKFVKLFHAEYQVGDARFDDAIYIRDEHRAETESLLSHSGAREAILSLASRGGSVEIDHGTVRFEIRERHKTDVAGYLLAALVLSRYVNAVG